MEHLRPALVLTLLFTLLTGVAFPLGFTGAAGVVFPWRAGGSLIEHGGKTVGSALLGQNFTQDKYFHGRPSATTDTDPNDASKTVPSPYNAAGSGASNLGSTAKPLIERVTADIAKAGPKPVPADAVTTSASGLDPHISAANAERQIPRIATARGVAESKIRDLTSRYTEHPILGVIGETRVNVLMLNLALDAL